jgi:hypothetical protein
MLTAVWQNSYNKVCIFVSFFDERFQKTPPTHDLTVKTLPVHTNLHPSPLQKCGICKYWRDHIYLTLTKYNGKNTVLMPLKD